MFGRILSILSDIVKLLEGIGVIKPDGSFRQPTSAEDAIIALRLKGILEKHGIQINEDELADLLPRLLKLFNIQ